MAPSDESLAWYDGDDSDTEDTQILQYGITTTANDFNVLTIHSFISSGRVFLPAFQRNYVWDIIKASKLIESLILGLPVPSLYLYETESDRYDVIDGHQRLMTIYYFLNGRFPKKEKTAELRKVFDSNRNIPKEILSDDAFYSDFKLKFSKNDGAGSNRFTGLKYDTLGEFKTQFELRPVRNFIISQSSPPDDDSSMYEIFNRLNTGGMRLYPQEIRASLFHSPMYDVLTDLNSRPVWRSIINSQMQDPHMKDIELLLRCFSMLLYGDSYSPSMVKFLNTCSRKMKRILDGDDVKYLKSLFDSFLVAISPLDKKLFIGEKGRFNFFVFESVFAATCRGALAEKRVLSSKIKPEHIISILKDSAFVNATKEGTSKTSNVQGRLKRACALIPAL